jgi:hypothetical protein
MHRNFKAKGRHMVTQGGGRIVCLMVVMVQREGRPDTIQM